MTETNAEEFNNWLTLLGNIEKKEAKWKRAKM